ncbi:MAG TPA: hypothetical protein DCR93_06825, partial [Cytophagales bacterium]|nr:hypothetical protein [Cytophagales bacterium]
MQQVNFGGKGMAPWRAGANENTIITLSTDVMVEGEPLAAGSYGLHMVLSEDQSVTVIFSKNTSSWGSFWYKEEEDALRVQVQAEEAPHTELLTYDWVAYAGNSATLALSWEKLRIPIQFEVDLVNTVMVNLRDEMRGQAGFSAQAQVAAANFCYQNQTHQKEGIAWAQQSGAAQPSFNAFALEGLLYAQLEQGTEAATAMDKALAYASPPQVNFLAYQLLPLNPEKAVEYFQQNVKGNPENPNFHDSLGEGYLALGQDRDAIKSFRKALALDPPQNVRENSEKNLRELGVDID